MSGLASPARRRFGLARRNGVLGRPAAVDRVLEDRVHERDDVAHRLRGEAGVEHRRGDGLDVGDGDAVDGLVADARRDVDALHRFAVLQVGLAGALDGEPTAQRVDDIVQRVALEAGADRAALLGLLQLAEVPLGLGARQAAGATLAARHADLAVELAPVECAPTAVEGTCLR